MRLLVSYLPVQTYSGQQQLGKRIQNLSAERPRLHTCFSLPAGSCGRIQGTIAFDQQDGLRKHIPTGMEPFHTVVTCAPGTDGPLPVPSGEALGMPYQPYVRQLQA